MLGINLVKTHPENIAGEDEKLVDDLNYNGYEFSMR